MGRPRPLKRCAAVGRSGGAGTCQPVLCTCAACATERARCDASTVSRHLRRCPWLRIVVAGTGAPSWPHRPSQPDGGPRVPRQGGSNSSDAAPSGRVWVVGLPRPVLAVNKHEIGEDVLSRLDPAVAALGAIRTWQMEGAFSVGFGNYLVAAEVVAKFRTTPLLWADPQTSEAVPNPHPERWQDPRTQGADLVVEAGPCRDPWSCSKPRARHADRHDGPAGVSFGRPPDGPRRAGQGLGWTGRSTCALYS